MSDQVDEIRARIDIVDLVGQSIALKRAGKDWKGLCPFHDDKNPSFQVSSTLGRYRCWSCGEHGDVFTWVMKTQRVEFPDALKILAERAGVTLTNRPGKSTSPNEKAQQLSVMKDALFFFQEQLAKSHEASAYCEKRGLDKGVIKDWELGYAPDEGSALASYLRRKGHSLSECKSLFLVDEDPGGGYFDKFRGRLMFPIRDERGDLVGFGGRILGDGQPKYINSSDTPLYRKSRVLYGMHRAKDRIAKDRIAVLAEGYLDVIACHIGGVTHALASLGTSLAEDHARLLKRWCDGVVVLYDSDAAGQKAADRAIEVLEAEGVKVRVAVMPAGDDPDTLLKSGGPAALEKAVSGGLKPLEYRLHRLKLNQSTETEEFWAQALALIASAPSDREMELQLMNLAPLYPFLKDKKAALERLRSDAFAQRKGSARSGSSFRSAGSAVKISVSPAEKVILQAFLFELLRKRALEIMQDEDLFETQLGADVAKTLRETFKEPPSGAPSDWLHKIEREDVQQTLSDLLLSAGSEPIHETWLLDSADRLRKNREKRLLGEMRSTDLDDAKRLELNDRLRKLNAGKQN